VWESFKMSWNCEVFTDAGGSQAVVRQSVASVI